MDDLKLYSWSEKGLDSLIQTVRVFSDDIWVEFGIQVAICIKSLQEGESY